MQIPHTEIVIARSGEEIWRRVVPPGEYTIGREADCAIYLDDDGLSRRHARLTINYDHALIEDLSSSNGTFVNEQTVVTPTRLWPNQKIRVGPAVTITLRRLKIESNPEESLAPVQAAVQRILPEQFLREKKYEIGGVVAQGGMGAILNAKELTTERGVAMKVMLDSLSSEDVVRFIGEAKVTAQLEHPNIVPIYELSVDENGQVFYTMKFVRGVTLGAVLGKLDAGDMEIRKRYPLAQLLTIFQKVCDAMAFAHSKGVIHRDLKPDNVMLGDYGEVLVMDWGLAKTRTEESGRGRDLALMLSSGQAPVFSATATMAGTVMGTPQYMSPEQARGEIETLDARTDVYALGAILYQILAWRPSVSGDDPWEVVRQVAAGKIEALTSAASSKAPIPQSLVAVVRKAMAHDKEERYVDVPALQRDIAAYQGGFATSAERADLLKQCALLVKRNKGVFSTAAVASLVIAGLGIWFLVNVTQERNLAQRARKTAERERDRAESTLTELRGTAPTFSEQARALVNAGKIEEALAKVGYAVQLDPQAPAFQLQRANLLEASQRLSDAAAAYRQVLALEPVNRTAQENLALCERLEKENGGSPQLRRELEVQLVDALINEGRGVEVASLSLQLGQNIDAIETALRARLKEYISQPGWHADRIKRRLDGTFEVYLDHLKLGNLSLLRGFPISAFGASYTDLADLRAVARLPLTALNIGNTNVTDLSPLRGLRLESLDCLSCRITDLEPLRGMSLKTLNLVDTRVSNLSPLVGMPLQNLRLAVRRVTSFTPLRDLPLRHLDLGDITYGDHDMGAFATCRELEDIAIPSSVGNIEALRALPKLTRLRITGRQEALVPAEKFWADFKPEMEAVGTIYIALQKMGVTLEGNNHAQWRRDGAVEMNASETAVSDLNFLRGLPIASLSLYKCPVTDLEPLRHLPLREITLSNTKVTSVAPLRDCPTLEMIQLPNTATDVETLRGLPSLRLISYKYPVTETSEQFWRDYDAKKSVP